jgi:hypothetical protein
MAMYKYAADGAGSGGYRAVSSPIWSVWAGLALTNRGMQNKSIWTARRSLPVRADASARAKLAFAEC